MPIVRWRRSPPVTGSPRWRGSAPARPGAREPRAGPPVQPGASNPAPAAIRIRSLVRQRSLVVLLTDLDDSPAAGELRAAARLLLPKHLPFIAGVASERVAALADAPARDELEVYRALAAQEYCHTLARNIASLRALGAAAVSAAPRELDRAVLEAYLGFRQRRRV